MGAAVANLPPELLIKIVSRLLLRDVLRCRLVCRSFLELVDNDETIQYAIELAIAGCVEVERLASRLDIPTRRRLLHQRRHVMYETVPVWNPMSPRSTQSVAQSRKFLRPDHRTTYAGNVFCVPYVSDTRKGLPTDRLLLEPDSMRFIALAPDTAYNAGLNPVYWTHSWTHTFNEPFITWNVDPGQDLIVLFVPGARESEVGPLDRKGIKIKCCSMSHSPTVNVVEHDVDLPFLSNVATLGIPAIEIFGTTIALIFAGMKAAADGGSEIRIVFIHSETHQIFSQFSRPCADVSGVTIMLDCRQRTNIALLDPTTFALVFGGETQGIIDIYTITDQRVTSFGGKYRMIAHVSIFQLPPHHPGVSFNAVCCATSYGKRYIFANDEEPLSDASLIDVSPLNCLLHLKIIYSEPGALTQGPRLLGYSRRSMGIRYVLSLEPFLRAVDAYNARTLDVDNDGDPLLIPWAVWGPLSSRSFRSNPGTVDFTTNLSCYGSRVHFKSYELESEVENVIMDFNTSREARDGFVGPDATDQAAYHFVDAKHLTSIPKGNIFLQDVAGRLPYWKSRLASTGGIWGARDEIFGGNPWINYSGDMTTSTPLWYTLPG